MPTEVVSDVTRFFKVVGCDYDWYNSHEHDQYTLYLVNAGNTPTDPLVAYTDIFYGERKATDIAFIQDENFPSSSDSYENNKLYVNVTENGTNMYLKYNDIVLPTLSMAAKEIQLDQENNQVYIVWNDNIVDPVTGETMITRLMSASEDGKINLDIIRFTGDGTKFLASDGSWKSETTLSAGDNIVIDDNIISTPSNTITRDLTAAQYNDLPDSKLTDNIEYNIMDGSTSDEIYGLINDETTALGSTWSSSKISQVVSGGGYSAGANIQIENNVISATDTTYSAGDNIYISPENRISATYSAGQNVSITGNIISAVDTKYTAGANISISSQNVISANNTTYSAGNNITITSSNVIVGSDQKVQSTFSTNDSYYPILFNKSIDATTNSAYIGTGFTYNPSSKTLRLPGDGKLAFLSGADSASSLDLLSYSYDSTRTVPHRFILGSSSFDNDIYLGGASSYTKNIVFRGNSIFNGSKNVNTTITGGQVLDLPEAVSASTAGEVWLLSVKTPNGTNVWMIGYSTNTLVATPILTTLTGLTLNISGTTLTVNSSTSTGAKISWSKWIDKY